MDVSCFLAPLNDDGTGNWDAATEIVLSIAGFRNTGTWRLVTGSRDPSVSLTDTKGVWNWFDWSGTPTVSIETVKLIFLFQIFDVPKVQFHNMQIDGEIDGLGQKEIPFAEIPIAFSLSRSR